MGFPNSEYYFNLVFFVVLLSVITQGISIPWAANKLKVTEPLPVEPVTELSAGLLPAGFISVELRVIQDTPAENRRILELSLPAGVLLTSIERGGRFVIPKGDTVLSTGDKVWGLARPSNLIALKNLFGEAKPMNHSYLNNSFSSF